MSLFVEVQSEEKGVTVVINLEHVVEIAPLRDGGCHLFFNDGASSGGLRSMKVKDSYNQFKQLAIQTVSSEDIAKKIANLNIGSGVTQEVKKSPGRPPKAKEDDLEIPTL